MKNTRRAILIHSVLTSTLFMSPTILHAAVETTLNSVQTGPYTTGNDGNVTVTQTGAIQSGGGVVPYTFDRSNAFLNLDQGNKYFQPGSITSTDRSAVVVSATNAHINVAPVSSIKSNATQPLILIDNTNATLKNAGLLFTLTDSVVRVESKGINATAFNDLTGVMTLLVDDSVPTLYVAGNNFELNNLGVIQNLGDQHTLYVESGFFTPDASFKLIQNSGFLKSTDSSTVFVNTFSGPSGDFINTETGVITSDSYVMDMEGDMGRFINRGRIEASGNDNAVYIGADNSIESFTNAGRMSNAGGDEATVYIKGKNPVINGFKNNGTIINGEQDQVAIDLSKADHVSIVNSGNVDGGILLAERGTDTGSGQKPVLTMTDGVVTGRVIGQSGGPGNVYLIKGGTLVSIESSGDIETANTYNLLDGVVSDYIKLPYVIANSHTFNLNGTHVGYISTVNDDDEFNISGGSFDKLSSENPDRLDNTLNIEKSFTTNAQILMEKINVNNPGTVFTTNQVIHQFNSFTINQGTTFTSNSRIVPQLNNDQIALFNVGTFYVPHQTNVDYSRTQDNFYNNVLNTNLVKIASTGVLRIKGNNDGSSEGNTLFGQVNNFTGLSTIAVFSVDIAGPQCRAPFYGQMIVDSFLSDNVLSVAPLQQFVYLETGTFVAPRFSGFLPDGSNFDIIRVNTGGFADPNDPLTINNQAAILPYPSELIYFTMDTLVLPIEGNSIGDPQFPSVVRLTSHRKPFFTVANSHVTEGVANTLDVLVADPCQSNNTLYDMFSQFDQIETQDGVNQAMQSLVPGFNYGLIAAAQMGMNITFDAIMDRIYELSWNGRRTLLTGNQSALATAPTSTGTGFGDNTNAIDMWIRAIGGYVDQGLRKGYAGYRAKGAGLTVGFDWGLNDCTTYGLALSYTKANVDDKNWAPKDGDVDSWQGTLYGAYDFCYGLYLDAMFGLAHNKYHTNRVIRVGNFGTTAQADYNGTQWGLEGELGIAIPNSYNYFFAPFVRLKYIHVGFDEYQETGADVLSLHVEKNHSSDFLGGIGVRLAKDFVCADVTWVPEFIAMAGYDFHNDGQQTLAQFLVTTGPAFNTNGITPAKPLLDLGLALSAVNTTSVLTMKYNVEFRKQLIANSAYLQYTYNWS